MNKNEFIAKLQMVYVGDNNAIEELINAYVDLQNQVEEKDKVINEANNILSEILIIKQNNIYRPIKNTSSQEVYKTICMLNEVLKTPYRTNYEILERGKNENS